MLPRLCIICFLLSLTGCLASQPKQFSMQKQQHIGHIAIAQIEYDHSIDIRQDNPLLLAMGSSGFLLGQATMEQKKQEYMRVNQALGKDCATQMRSTLTHKLQSYGFKVVNTDMDYWSIIRDHKAKRMPAPIDAILRIQVRRIGYWSSWLSKSTQPQPYKPAAMLEAKLIDIHTRQELYSDTIAVASEYSPLYTQVLNSGAISMVQTEPAPQYHYKNFQHLLSHAKQSSKGVKHVAYKAATHIANALNPNNPQVALGDKSGEQGFDLKSFLTEQGLIITSKP